jgi:stage II sporulation protein D
MRRFLIPSLVFLIAVLLVLPTAMGRMFSQTASPPEETRAGSDTFKIKVYFPETKQVQEMLLAEYLKGVVAAEMPPEFNLEALKAQMVAARTYAIRRMQQFNGPGRGGCPLNPSADVCASPGSGQAYFSREELEKRLGPDAAASYWQRLNQVQAATDGLVLRYRGQLIDPLYHSVSGTKTEDAAEYFPNPVPYLKAVDDHWGADSPKMRETRRFSAQALASALSTTGKAVAVPALTGALKAGKPPVEVISRTGTGRVKEVRVGGQILTGREFRERLGLRSTNFTVSVEKGEVVIQTVGNGHGVGMSQYGANGMAREGKSFQEILRHYYSGVEVAHLFTE